MRLITLLVGPLLISAAVYAQHSPIASSTPAPPTHTSPPPSPPSPPPSFPSSSSSGGMHSSSSSGSSFPSSSPGWGGSASSSNHGGSSAGSSHGSPPGIDHSGSGSSLGSLGSSGRNEHEHEREASRDSHNGGSQGRNLSTEDSNSGKHHGRDPSSTRDGALDERKDSSARGSHDQDRNWNGLDYEPVVAGTHNRDAKVNDPSLAGRGRGPEGRPEPSSRFPMPCEREREKGPCTRAEPQLSHADWRAGRCKDGPCEPCPEGTTPTKYGNCGATPKPATTAPATCAAGTVRYGASCVSAANAGVGLAAWQAAQAARCTAFYSEGVRISSQLSSARAWETHICFVEPDSPRCRFAHLDVVSAEASCSMLETQAVGCGASIPSCL